MPNDMMRLEKSTTALQAGRHIFEKSLDLSGQETDDIQIDGHGFADQLLSALVNMANRSKRRQADLCVALARCGLQRDHAQVGAALQALQQDGYIDHLVPLYDGGLLLTVTSRGLDKRNSAPGWTMLHGSYRMRA